MGGDDGRLLNDEVVELICQQAGKSPFCLRRTDDEQRMTDKGVVVSVKMHVKIELITNPNFLTFSHKRGRKACATHAGIDQAIVTNRLADRHVRTMKAPTEGCKDQNRFICLRYNAV